jgi:hypothetical protein
MVDGGETIRVTLRIVALKVEFGERKAVLIIVVTVASIGESIGGQARKEIPALGDGTHLRFPW